MRKQNAFTLIELLIVSSIFSVVMLAVYLAFNTGVFGYKHIEENLDAYQAARQILSRINLDLRNSFSLSDAAGRTGFSGSSTELNFLTLVDTFSADNFKREFALVSYKLQADKLLRLCRKNTEALNDKSEIPAEEMAQGLAIKFSYGYLSLEKQEIVFQDSWGANSRAGATTLPVAVKISFGLTGIAGQALERTIYLPSAGQANG
jgi:prepilin-type N-terminal cleavage/methylation domain-containing protein